MIWREYLKVNSKSGDNHGFRSHDNHAKGTKIIPFWAVNTLHQAKNDHFTCFRKSKIPSEKLFWNSSKSSAYICNSNIYMWIVLKLTSKHEQVISYLFETVCLSRGGLNFTPPWFEYLYDEVGLQNEVHETRATGSISKSS